MALTQSPQETTQSKDEIFGYNNNGGLTISGKEAFQYLGLNKNYPLINENNLEDKTHNILEENGYSLIGITLPNQRNCPDYMQGRINYIDGEEIVYYYKANEIYFRLIYAKSLQKTENLQISNEVLTFQNALSQILSGLPN